MGSRRRRLDPVGPFGNPDGSRADIEDVISEFVDFGGNPAYGHLATRANDSKVRVIVGKLGAGKTVYLRRLQDFQAHQDSVYADVPQQSLPKTEVVVKACQWFSDRVLVEKWMQIWERAIMRSLASHLLCGPELRQQLRDEQVGELEQSLLAASMAAGTVGSRSAPPSPSLPSLFGANVQGERLRGRRVSPAPATGGEDLISSGN
jgi:hypothetical protein